MSTHTATVLLLPERAAQFRNLLDDCLAGLTHWIHSARAAATAPDPRLFSQFALAIDRLVTVAARIDPASNAPVTAAPPAPPAPAAQPSASTSAPAARPVSPKTAIPSNKSSASTLCVSRTPSLPPASPTPSPPASPSQPSTITRALLRKRRRKKR